LAKELNGDMKGIKDLLNTLPEQIADMLESLEEQKADTKPDAETADYYAKAETIDKQIKDLKKLQKEVKDVEVSFPPKEKETTNLISDSKKAKDFERMKEVIGQMQEQKEVIGKIHDDLK